MTQKKYISGITLLEMMLVLAIAIVFIAIGINQYNQSQRDYTLRQIQANVALLFQGAKQYYYTNCRQRTSPNTTDVAVLDPVNPIPETYVVLDNNKDLLTGLRLVNSPNYLDGNWPPPVNRIVDKQAGNNGYFVQFNFRAREDHKPRSVYFNWLQGAASSNPTEVYWPSTVVGKIYHWRIQVSLKLVNNLNANVFKARLGADCTSSTPYDFCERASPGPYLIWERSPSFIGYNTRSSTWLTMARIKQFNNLYTNDDVYGATDPQYANDTAGYDVNGEVHLGNDYLCE